MLGHADNYIPANPLATPAHIVPEWYFWPFYAILRAFTMDFILPAKLWGVLAMFASILLLFFLPWLDRSPVRSGNYRPVFKRFFWILVLDVLSSASAAASRPTPLYVALEPARLGLLFRAFPDHPAAHLEVRAAAAAAVVDHGVGAARREAGKRAVRARQERARGRRIRDDKPHGPHHRFLVGLGFRRSPDAVADRRRGQLFPGAAARRPPSMSSIAHPEPLALASDGPLGKFDKQQLQRGFQVYKEVCAACHGLSLVAFRDLHALGYEEAEVKAIADQWPIEVPSINPDTGEAATRKAIPSDKFPSPYANETAARAANNNALPPDLSLITKARHGGAAYIRSLLAGYQAQPAELLKAIPRSRRPGRGSITTPISPI